MVTLSGQSRCAMCSCAREKGLACFAGDVRASPVMRRSQASRCALQSAQEAHDRALDEWEDANTAALALIGGCVAPHLRHLLRGEDNAHLAWSALKMHFQEGLVQRVEQLQSALRDVRQRARRRIFRQVLLPRSQPLQTSWLQWGLQSAHFRRQLR